jgi:hypothetical protein
MDLQMLDPAQRAPAPAWAMVLLGWCLGAACCEHSEARALALASSQGLGLRTDPSGRGPTWLPTTRELRAVEGVGAARAVDLARWFWAEAGRPGDVWDRLEEVPGVGPTLATRLRAQLAPGHRSAGLGAERSSESG